MAYRYWLSELSLLAVNTQRSYKLYFDRFLDFCGCDAEELYVWQRRLLDDGDPRSNREVVRRLVEFMNGLMDEGYASGSVVIAVNAVKSFMAANALVFPVRRSDVPRVVTGGSRVVGLDEIRLLLDHVDNQYWDRNTAVIFMLKDTGLRESDISGMDVVDYLGAELLEEDSGCFRVFKPYVTRKTGEIAYPHIGDEAIDAVDRYLGGRREGPLFFDRLGGRMSSNAISMIIRRIVAWVPGIEKVSAHSLRKTHRTLLEARMPESYVKKLQGKATDPYIHPEQTGELTEAYIRCYDALRVYGEQQKIDELKQQIEEERESRYSLEDRIRHLERLEEVRRLRDEYGKELEKHR